eukprot:552864-Amphidinium_carterae.1
MDDPPALQVDFFGSEPPNMLCMTGLEARDPGTGSGDQGQNQKLCHRHRPKSSPEQEDERTEITKTPTT